VTSLTTSAAIIEPTAPHTTPRTPASAQDGTVPGAGGSGNTSRYCTAGYPEPAGGAAQNTDTCASNRSTAPQTRGTPASTQASFTRYRVGKLSVPSTTTS